MKLLNQVAAKMSIGDPAVNNHLSSLTLDSMFTNRFSWSVNVSRTDCWNAMSFSRFVVMLLIFSSTRPTATAIPV